MGEGQESRRIILFLSTFSPSSPRHAQDSSSSKKDSRESREPLDTLVTFNIVPQGLREGSPHRKSDNNPSDLQQQCAVCPQMPLVDTDDQTSFSNSVHAGAWIKAAHRGITKPYHSSHCKKGAGIPINS